MGNVLRMLLLHVGTGWSLRETAVRAKLAGVAEVSDVTLLNRLRQSETGCVTLSGTLEREWSGPYACYCRISGAIGGWQRVKEPGKNWQPVSVPSRARVRINRRTLTTGNLRL